MEEESDTAYEQLKRADHLIYVTLKYTKTVDVIKNTIKRLISALDYAILDVLEYHRKKRKLKKIPISPRERAEILEEIYKKEKAIRDYVDFYFLIKKIDQSRYSAIGEYRKNLALIANGFIVDIETLRGYYNKTKEFINFTMELIKGK
jgi:hypothetical protein